MAQQRPLTIINPLELPTITIIYIDHAHLPIIIKDEAERDTFPLGHIF